MEGWKQNRLVRNQTKAPPSKSSIPQRSTVTKRVPWTNIAWWDLLLSGRGGRWIGKRGRDGDGRKVARGLLKNLGKRAGLDTNGKE